MPSVEETTFEDALERTKSHSRDLLLGNGFSMAADDGFNYRRLLDRASVPNDVRAIFTQSRTPNFETVMGRLLAESVGMNRDQAKEAREKIEALKKALIASIHEVRPRCRTTGDGHHPRDRG